MAAPATRPQLLDLVEKSLIVEKEWLDAYLARQSSIPDDPRQLASQLCRDGILTIYQAKMLLTGKYKGFVFGKYKVLDQIGAGGEGNVYLCEHLLMKRRVAVKVLPIDRAADPTLLERFYHEARAAAALDHPNIVRVHDIDQEGELHFLVMEYVDGTNLQKLVKKKGPMEILRAVNYIRQAAIGLQHVHQAGLVHRDIKPGNLLLDRGGTIKILDLGLARFFQDTNDALTQHHDESSILGTADYISPEQGMNSHTVDIRADIYSLGATFYFLLAGRAPFEGGTVTQKLLYHQMREPEPIRSVRVAVPEAMASVLLRMMAKDAKERFQAPAEVVQALGPFHHEIAPPPDDEMPKLSLAVTVSPADGGPLSSLSAIGMSASGVRNHAEPITTKRLMAAKTKAQTPTLPVAKLLSATPSAPAVAKKSSALVPVRKPAPPVPLNRPQSVRVTAPAIVEEPEPRRRRKKRSRFRVAAMNRRVQYLVGGGVGALVLGVASYFLLPLVVGNWQLSQAVDTSQTSRAAPPPAPAPPAVAQAPNRETMVLHVSNDGATKSLREALNRATPGSRIVIFAQDGVHEELAHLDGNLPNDITIEGQARDGRTLIWRTPRNAKADQPVLSLANGEGLKFKGIIFDGQDLVDDLVVFAGRCTGVTLEDCSATGFRRRGIVYRSCEGETRKPAALVRTRIYTNREAESAICFVGASNQNIDIRDCRLEGPFRSAFCLSGSTSGVGLHRNRIHRAQAGLLYRKAEPAHRAKLDVVANTFYQVTRGLHFECLPPPNGSGGELVVQHNIFAHCPTPAQVDDFNPEPEVITAQWLWHDEPGDPSRAAPPGTVYFRKSFTLAPQTFAGATLNVVCDDSFVVWLNGRQIGRGGLSAGTRRVMTFDVSSQLRPGKNVIAVSGTNKLGSKGASPAGLLVQLSTPSAANPILAATDASWKSAKQDASGWTDPDFNDDAWLPVRVLASYGKGDASWQHLVWDVALQTKYKSANLPFLNPASNVHDVSAKVAFPSLDWQKLEVNLSTNPANDREFLRYRRDHTLARAGTNQSAIGAPPVE